MTTNNNQNNEPIHSDNALSAILADVKEHLGIVICAEAGHGKSYTAFSLVKEAMADPDFTVIILSPSTIWRRNFGKINCVRVGTYEFNPIVAHEQTKLEVTPYLRDTIHINLDKKWTYLKSNWFENLLQSKQNLLLEIKYLNGRRIKAFETVVLEFIYSMQQHEIDRNANYSHHYLIVLEELQNSFGTYSMNSDDSLDLMTLFTQSRSDANIHYIGIGQRLNDISCKVVERLRPLIGLTLGENSLRKLKAMIPDEATKKRIQSLPQRHWIYLNGTDNPEIVIPDYHKEGKVTYLRDMTQQAQPKPKYPSYPKALWLTVTGQAESYKRKHPELYEVYTSQKRQNNNEEQEDEIDKEDSSELDVTMSDSPDDMFPTDE